MQRQMQRQTTSYYFAKVKLKLMKHTSKQHRSWKTPKLHYATCSKQRKRKISNWNLNTVSQPSENSKNKDDNDAIEENWYQIKKPI